MKNYILLFLAVLTLGCCKNDDDQPQDPISQLPPVTQTGEQTFGCLINREPFVPPSFGNNAPNAFYQFVDGAYTLGISAGTGGGNTTKLIVLQGLDVPPLGEISYQLVSESSGDFSGIYSFGGGNIVPQTLTTICQIPGNLIITNFDNDNFIISGTFEFTVINNEGNQINLTEGRFDLNFTN